MISHSDPLQHLLDTVSRLVLSGQEWSMADLAREAGLSRASLYRLVASRQALIEILADQRGIRAQPSARERILCAAVKLVQERGLDGFTIEAVAMGAEVSPVTVYRHYSDREALLEATFAQAIPRQHAQALSLDGQDPEEDLAALATAALAFLREHGELVRLSLGAPRERMELLGRMHDSPLGTTRNLAKYLERQMDAARLPRQDPELLALAFVSMLLTFGCIAPAFPGTHPVPASPELGRVLARLFLNGARSPT